MSASRKITVISTKNAKIETFETAATTWGEFRQEIQNNYDFNSLKAVENTKKMTLESLDAVLPEGDFKIFLRPTKTKSGAKASDYSSMSFSELRAVIKGDEELKKFLSSYVSGKNWTQLTTDQVKEGITKFYAANKSSKPAVEKAPEVSVEEAQSEEVPVEANLLDKLVAAKETISGILSNVDTLSEDQEVNSEAKERLEVILDDVSALEEIFTFSGLTPTKGLTTTVADIVKAVGESAAEKDARLKKEAEEEEKKAKAAAKKAEEEALQKEIQEMNAGFDD